jgi:hypothetical protein
MWQALCLPCGVCTGMFSFVRISKRPSMPRPWFYFVLCEMLSNVLASNTLSWAVQSAGHPHWIVSYLLLESNKV